MKVLEILCSKQAVEEFLGARHHSSLPLLVMVWVGCLILRHQSSSLLLDLRPFLALRYVACDSIIASLTVPVIDQDRRRYDQSVVEVVVINHGRDFP